MADLLTPVSLTPVSLTPVSVSLLTISQRSRFKCLQNLAQLIQLQNYTNIIEWIIVEGSRNQSDADINKENIKSLHCSNVPIKYIEYEFGLKLSDLRNKGNDACIGDIIVVMDDDDYYPSCRVSHAVQKLQESGYQIAGTSNVLMYDYNINKLYQFNVLGPYHATNNTMAYTREYLNWNRHDPGLINAEEKSFTRNFNNFMVQLDPEKCIIVSSHSSNTVCKQYFVDGVHNQILHHVKYINKPLTNYIEPHIISWFKRAFKSINTGPQVSLKLTKDDIINRLRHQIAQLKEENAKLRERAQLGTEGALSEREGALSESAQLGTKGALSERAQSGTEGALKAQITV